MLTEDRRKTIAVLYACGKKKKEIARFLNVDPKTVRAVVSGDSTGSVIPRADKIIVSPDVLRQVYARCDGYIRRVYEILTEEEKIKIGYSTLTRRIREAGLGEQPARRYQHIGDVPGQEMQQDTSPYKLNIGGSIRPVLCSALYLRYSKIRYVKFYPRFNRFMMKCFFHEALLFWGYAARTCVIDNTNLAVLYNTGSAAVFHPEMLNFAKPYGFEWLAHEKGHANRKAGEERVFWTVETNFFPGRSFKTIEDLNRQAFDWATVLHPGRPLSRTRLIPAALFETEKSDLVKLPAYIEPPSIAHRREIDSYGYIAFNANYYWIPGKSRGEVSVIEYSERIRIFPPNQEPIEYSLPGYGTRNEKFTPKGAKTNPYEPRHIKKSCAEEETRLKALSQICTAYLDFVRSKECSLKQKPNFIRQLYALSKKLAPELFFAVLSRALEYRVFSIDRLTRIAGQLLQKGEAPRVELPQAEDYESRETYQAGRFSQEAEFSFENKEQTGANEKEGDKNE